MRFGLEMEIRRVVGFREEERREFKGRLVVVKIEKGLWGWKMRWRF